MVVYRPQAPRRPDQLIQKPKATHVVSISKCTNDYARALANPFTGPLACVPSYPAMMSLKTKQWTKGTFSTSATTGLGFCVVDPYRTAFNDVNSNVVSFSTYALSTINSLAPGAFGFPTNAQFSTAELGPLPSQLQFRLVACGVRIRYIGTELNRGGQKIGLMDPTRSSLDGHGIADFNAEITSVKFPIAREWTSVLYRPVDNADLTFATSITPGYNFSMGFIVQGASSTTPLEYEYELYSVVEYQGRIARGQTPSHYDPTGMAAVNSVSVLSKALLPNSQSDAARETQIIGQTTHYIANGISHANTISKTIDNAVQGGSSLMSSLGKAWNFVEGLAAPLMALI